MFIIDCFLLFFIVLRIIGFNFNYIILGHYSTEEHNYLT